MFFFFFLFFFVVVFFLLDHLRNLQRFPFFVFGKLSPLHPFSSALESHLNSAWTLSRSRWSIFYGAVIFFCLFCFCKAHTCRYIHQCELKTCVWSVCVLVPMPHFQSKSWLRLQDLPTARWGALSVCVWVCVHMKGKCSDRSQDSSVARVMVVERGLDVFQCPSLQGC